MPLTKEQLLIPRYKVKDKYPGMEAEPFRIGQIITLQWHKEVDGNDYKEGFIHIPIKYIPRSFMWQSFFDLFPNIFEPLPWWSDRKPEDMPDFLFCPAKKSYYIVEEWGLDSFVIYGRTKRQYCNYLPATKEEYTAYINQKQQ